MPLRFLKFPGGHYKQYPSKTPMQAGQSCHWYLLRLTDSELAVQYTGPDPDKHFPLCLTGIYFPLKFNLCTRK